MREVIGIRIGYAGTDFTQNVLRTVCEERLNLAVERPAAICQSRTCRCHEQPAQALTRAFGGGTGEQGGSKRVWPAARHTGGAIPTAIVGFSAIGPQNPSSVVTWRSG